MPGMTDSHEKSHLEYGVIRSPCTRRKSALNPTDCQVEEFLRLWSYIFAAINLPSRATPSPIFSGGTVTKLRRSVFCSAAFA